MLEIGRSQERADSKWLMFPVSILVLMVAVWLFAVPVNAEVPGLAIGEPEFMYKVDDVTVPTIDGSLSTWKKDDNNLYILNGKWDDFKLYYGPLNNPYQNYVGKSRIDHNGWIGLTWIQGVYKYSDGTLLGFVHREAYWSDSSQDCFYIGLAKSTDNGLNWKYLGDVLKPYVNYKEPVLNGVNSACGNIAGVPYLIVGNDLYLYYMEQTGTEKRTSVAKAALSDVKSAIDSNTVTPFYKYSNGTWTEPGMGGIGSNIIPGGTVPNEGVDYWQGNKLFDFHSDAAYSSGLGKYLITVNDESNGRLLLFSSPDGLNWSEETVLDDSANGAYFRPVYSCFMSLSPGTSEDCSTVGNDFYILYPRDMRNNGQRYYRIHCVVGGDGRITAVNDDSTSISYDSGWFYSFDRNLGDYNNDGHFSNTVGAVCRYTFTGTSIVYYSEKNSDMGNVDVYIDDEFKQNVNLYNNTRLTRQMVYGINGLPYGSHTIKIVNKTNSYGCVDYFGTYPINYEAENAALSNGAFIEPNSGASGGKQVNFIGGGTSSNGTVIFNNINAVSAGDYKLTLYYGTAESRSFFVTVNNQLFEQLQCPSTGDWNTIGSASMIVSLNAGNNTIKIDNGSAYAPNLDRITLEPMNAEGRWTYDYGNLNFVYDYNNGTYDMSWNGTKRLSRIYSSVQLGSRVLKSIDYPSHVVSLTNFSNALGNGKEVTITHAGPDMPDMIQHIYLYDGGKQYYLTQVELSGSNLSTNNMAPVEMQYNGGINIGAVADGRMLYVPFDNDAFTNYASKNAYTNILSYEVSAVYDNTSRNGLILGSVTHDTWKTGVAVSAWNNSFNSLKVYGGVTSNETRDSLPHGSISGGNVASPLVLVGYYSDWRTGLEDYGNANAGITPKLAFDKGVPFAWNTWAAFQKNFTPADVISCSDFIKNNLQNNNFVNDDTVYINYDAGWEDFPEADVIASANHIRANGQTPGGYMAPFSFFPSGSNTLDSYVPGTNNAYTFRDIALKDVNGNLLPLIDGGYALDPTHPGTKQQIDYYFDKFNTFGWKFAKLDFVNMGACEGVHYDSGVKTGIQAYNQGMAYIDSKVDTDTFFLSLSIAPVFPSQYAHSRRMACDTWGNIGASSYGARAVNYGWWINGRLYSFNDPDHIVLVDGNSTEAEAKTRVNLSAIAGTLFLDSDNLKNAKAQSRAVNYLTNANINALAKLNMAFRPVEGNTGEVPANVYVLEDNGTYYLAVFNFSSSSSSTVNVDLARAGLSGTADYTVTDLWTGAASSARGTYSVTLGAMQSTIVRLN